MPNKLKTRFFATFVGILCSSFTFASSFEVLNEAIFPSNVFTQGFEKSEDQFYLSSGGYGTSFIAVIDADGQERKRKKLSDRFFSEGLTIKDGKIYVLTWKKGVLLVLDKDTLSLNNALRYSGEGWGLTQNENHFIFSNGSEYLHFKDFDTFKTQHRIAVTYQGKPVKKLNELEFAEGLIWANAWHDDHIYAINPDTGHVIERWNLSDLRRKLKLRNHEAVLNGIAYDQQTKAFWVTGKLWPKRYLVKFDIAAAGHTNRVFSKVEKKED